MKRLSYLLPLVLLIAAAACSDDSTTPDSGPAPDKGQPVEAGIEIGTTKPDLDLTDKGQPDTLKAASYCGWLSDAQGVMIKQVGVIICNDTECHSATSGPTGEWCIGVSVATDWELKVAEAKVGSVHYGEVIFPLVLTQAELDARKKIDLGKVILPLRGKAVALDTKNGGTMDLGGGVLLKVQPGSAVLPPLVKKADISAIKIDKAWVHPRLQLALPASKASYEAVYALAPAEVAFKPKAATLELPAGKLTAGTKLELYRVDDKTGKVSLHTEAVVDSNGKISTAGSKGLSGLSWYFVYKK